MQKMNREQILYWLKEQDSDKLKELWQLADSVRKDNVGDEVHLRGLIEIGNYCNRRCTYCGLNAGNKKIQRYRMTADEIFDCIKQITASKFGTVVMQAGDDAGIKSEFIADIIRRTKASTDLAVTLSLGERPVNDFELWKRAGADRYLLRFETSDMNLYHLIHPVLRAGEPDRFELLQQLRRIGYEIGGGGMVGTTGQSFEILAGDIETFAKLDLDMIGIGPYIPNADAPLGKGLIALPEPPQQVPNSILMVYKTIALARCLCPQANIPATTAVGTVDVEAGQLLALQRGANVIMPNITPEKYKRLYEVYPDKQSIFDGNKPKEISQLLSTIGRIPGRGKGNRIKN